jgi:hypothetical protein
MGLITWSSLNNGIGFCDVGNQDLTRETLKIRGWSGRLADVDHALIRTRTAEGRGFVVCGF